MAVRLTRVERKARTRDEILEAAHRVFLRDGFHRATLEDIAEEAGYTTGAVYSNFDGKDGLFLALLDRAVRCAPGAPRRALRGRTESRRGLCARAPALLAETARREPLWAPLLVEFWTHASRDPRLRAEALWRHDRVLDAMGEALAGDRRAVRRRLVTSGARARPVRVRLRSGHGARAAPRSRRASPPEAFEEEFLLFVNSHLRPAEPEGART